MPGGELTLTKDSSPSDPVALDLSWGNSCEPADADYAVYEGTLGDFTSHVSRLCSTGGSNSATLTGAAGDTYYLVVPTGLGEGSYGRDGNGAQRPQAALACFEQLFCGCP